MSNPVRNSILAGAMAAVLVPAAMAQTASSDASAAPVLEEVMITAQKRTENLQDVPISVQAIDAARLDERNVVSLSGINDGSVPGLNLAPYPGSSDFYFPTFRGITTNTAFISAPVPIAVHIDGVFVGQLAGPALRPGSGRRMGARIYAPTSSTARRANAGPSLPASDASSDAALPAAARAAMPSKITANRNSANATWNGTMPSLRPDACR